MKSLLLIVAVAIIVMLIWRSRKGPSAAEQECLNAILGQLKSDSNTRANTIADILQEHGFTKETADSVTRLIKPRLNQTGIRPDEQGPVLHEISRAKHHLPD